jgi:hypothetical protein
VLCCGVLATAGQAQEPDPCEADAVYRGQPPEPDPCAVDPGLLRRGAPAGGAAATSRPARWLRIEGAPPRDWDDVQAKSPRAPNPLVGVGWFIDKEWGIPCRRYMSARGEKKPHGACNGGPPVGQWWEKRALSMARRANW